MRDQYDFTGGARGKHYKSMQAGYTITIYKVHGTTVVKALPAKKRPRKPSRGRQSS
jgi:hypothetical protein